MSLTNTQRNWKQLYPSEEQKITILKGYEESKRLNPLYGFMSTKKGYQIVQIASVIWFLYLTYTFIFQFHSDVMVKVLIFPICLILGMLLNNLVFCYLHVLAHIIMLFPDEWGKYVTFAGKRIIGKIPLMYFAYYHHFSKRDDNWYPLLGVGSIEAIRANNASHIHALTLFTRPLSLCSAILLLYYFPLFSAFMIGFDLTGMLCGPAHISQHDNEHWEWNISKYVCQFLQMIGVFAKPSDHSRHHNYTNNPHIFGSFTTSGLFHPIFPFFEKYFDNIYNKCFQNEKERPYCNFVENNLVAFAGLWLLSPPGKRSPIKIFGIEL